MIFLTVGTQLPFDRLVAIVDDWAGDHAGHRVRAQVGPTSMRPRNIESREFMSPGECRERIREARLVVAHAGMGTILSALELGTPVLVMPRRAALGEHRNDHQLATARRFSQVRGVTVAFDEPELMSALSDLEVLDGGQRISQYASDGFIDALRAFIDGDPQRHAVAR